MIGERNFAFEILGTGERLGENGCEQVISTHALNVGRHLFSATKTEKSKRAPSVPAPARGEERRRHHGLLENVLHGIGVQEVEDVSEREAVLLAERNIQAIVGRSRLQLEIEGAAETLAKRQSPSFVDASAEGSMDDQLHATAFVEEALGDYGSLRGNCAEDRAPRGGIFDDLFGARLVQPAFGLKPIHALHEIGGSVLL